VGRFAPRANPEQRPAAGVPEIDTLVATDVLSEGLNLQDCAHVVNYDLHWNPVRLIQRFGRVDRIGSEHDVIYAFNFLPETELDRTLGLRQKLSHRIQEIHETIGEDAAILDPSEELNQEAMYTIYTQGDISPYEEDDIDEFIDLHEAEETMRQLREDQPELYGRIANLRDGIRCGRQAGRSGGVVFCRAGRYRQLFLVNDDGEVVSRDVPRILNLLKCDPDTPAAPLPTGYNDLVMSVKRRFDEEVVARQAERRHTLSLTKAQQYVRRELRVAYGQADGDDLRRRITRLEAAFVHPALLPAVRSELNRIQRDGLTGMGLVEALSQAYHLYGLEKWRAPERLNAEENDDLPQIVCSEALV